MMHQAFIALGSNLQDPVFQVENAFIALSNLPKTQLLKKSSLYKTAPIDCPHSPDNIPAPDFINAVAEVQTELSAQQLMLALHAIEDEAGRARPFVNAPRVLDCDLLLYENMVIQSDALILPHPRMHSRGFVLLPLFEIAPQLSIPAHGKIEQLISPELSKDIRKIS
jgi:2-amino-4-hydroxy-6-hydroxymethyldihydropteridine diphosphokinase